MNQNLQSRFEKEVLEKGFLKDRSYFNKDKDGIYTNTNVWWMYRMWVVKEVQINKLEKRIEESFICGYTEAEYDFNVREVMK